jgi:hypothetical protein
VTPLDFVARLMAYCAATGASVTSYGRTPAHNRAVGGVPFSYHLLFLAADVVYDAPLPEDRRRRTAAQLGLRLVIEGDHDHLQPETLDRAGAPVASSSASAPDDAPTE